MFHLPITVQSRICSDIPFWISSLSGYFCVSSIISFTTERENKFWLKLWCNILMSSLIPQSCRLLEAITISFYSRVFFQIFWWGSQLLPTFSNLGNLECIKGLICSSFVTLSSLKSDWLEMISAKKCNCSSILTIVSTHHHGAFLSHS